MPENLIVAPARYNKYQGDAECVYRALCYTLSERVDEVDWGAFTEADWKILTAMAVTEGVAPLIYWKFNASQAHKCIVPNPVIEALRGSYYQTLARNTLLFDELDRILTALGEAGIPVIRLKGAALAQTLYENIGLRPMNDIDLFVKSGHLTKSIDILLSIGYSVQKITYHAVLIGGLLDNITVELHWSLIPDRKGASSSSDFLWELANNPQDVNILQLLYSSAHLLLQHLPEDNRLIWLFDLYTLVRSPMDLTSWKLVLNISEKLGWESAVKRAIDELQICFDWKMPGFWADEHSASKYQLVPVISQARYTRKRFFNALNDLNWSVRLRIIWFLLFPSKTYMLWRYTPNPTWIWIFYYPYRWLDLIRMKFAKIATQID